MPGPTDIRDSSEKLDPAGERQTPLSLRWNHQEHWPELKSRFGVSKKGAAVLLALGTAPDFVSYSRNKEHYTNRAKIRRYRDPLYSYANVVGTIDSLDNSLIENIISSPQNRGWQSACRATPLFRQELQRILDAKPGLTPSSPRESVWLRDENKCLRDYRDNRSTDKMRRNLAIINHQIREADISGYAAGPMVRIFNRNFQRGGRFYGLGPSWQNMPKAERKTITVNGEPTIEIDYCTLHPTMLYGMVGSAPPADSYRIGNFPRAMVKIALLVAINAKSELAAIRSLAGKDVLRSVGVEPGGKAAHRMARIVMQAVKDAHAPIAGLFGCDMGAVLMRQDSDIAEKVMLDMAQCGIPILPVHDSFIVPASQSDFLQETMDRAAYDFVGLKIGTERKVG